jgi:hypothetical protein
MRKIFTLPRHLAKDIEKSAKKWNISQSEFLRRCVTLSVFILEETKKKNKYLKEALDGAVRITFPEI